MFSSLFPIVGTRNSFSWNKSLMWTRLWTIMWTRLRSWKLPWSDSKLHEIPDRYTFRCRRVQTSVPRSIVWRQSLSAHHLVRNLSHIPGWLQADQRESKWTTTIDPAMHFLLSTVNQTIKIYSRCFRIIDLPLFESISLIPECVSWVHNNCLWDIVECFHVHQSIEHIIEIHTHILRLNRFQCNLILPSNER